MDSEQQNDPAALIRWNYTRDEWKKFQRWKIRRKGFFRYLFHRLSAARNQVTPEITITPGRVLIGNTQESFDGARREIRRVNIREAGTINIMEIAYRGLDAAGSGSGEIHIPVPRGKLKEAIQVQEKLMEKRGPL